jgi:hypothetical protein
LIKSLSGGYTEKMDEDSQTIKNLGGFVIGIGALVFVIGIVAYLFTLL